MPEPVSASLAGFIDAELSFEWQRKGALETRAYALITANLATATLLFALSAQFNVFQHLTTRMSVSLSICLISAILSTVAAAASGRPLNYPTVKYEAVAKLLADTERATVSEVEVAREIVHLKLQQLRGATEANDSRAIWSVIAFTLLALSALSLVISYGIKLASA